MDHLPGDGEEKGEKAIGEIDDISRELQEGESGGGWGEEAGLAPPAWGQTHKSAIESHLQEMTLVWFHKGVDATRRLHHRRRQFQLKDASPGQIGSGANFLNCYLRENVQRHQEDTMGNALKNLFVVLK